MTTSHLRVAVLFAALLAHAAVANNVTVPTDPALLFTLRTHPFDNGNNAETFPGLTTKLQASLRTWFNAPTLAIAFDTTTTKEQCFDTVQQCYKVMTIYFLAPSAASFTQTLTGKIGTAPEELKVEDIVVGPTIAPATLDEPTITNLIVTAVGAYFGASLLLLVIFLVFNYKCVLAVSD